MRIYNTLPWRRTGTNLRRTAGPDPWKHGYSNDADDTYRGVLHMGYCKRNASWDQSTSPQAYKLDNGYGII